MNATNPQEERSGGEVDAKRMLMDRAFKESFGTGERWWKLLPDGWYHTADHKGPYVGAHPVAPVEITDMAARYYRALAAGTPLPARAQGGAWISVSERLPDEEVLVMVYTPPRNGEDERRGFDAIVEGGWVEHLNNYEHFITVGGAGAAGPDCVCTGPSEEAPYTHWMPLPAAPSTAQERK